MDIRKDKRMGIRKDKLEQAVAHYQADQPHPVLLCKDERMAVRGIRTVDVLLAAIVVCSCTLVCTLSCLFLVLRLVTNAQAVTKHSQYHLTLQSLGSYVVLLAMTIHFSVIYLQNPKLDTAIRQMAAWFFFYNAFLTYIHPWILLLFNGEIRRRLTSLGECLQGN
ncbi:hypothetical protein ANCCEY_08380 [Ancylostoma ceylanicum]|uniref:Uncharacterized protein n=1 Tax=Ancylostoma ceylanicum TaxID=53326 RepID=A0A0D6LKM3_9BILA|nr:hypothetical protein ANCCEY_08380 [Ancylostoma ceylanicum]